MTTREELVTAEQFETFLARPENAEGRYELVHGEIFEKTMPTDLHGLIAGSITGEFYIYFRGNPIGRVTVEGRYRPTGSNHEDRLPDVAVILNDKPIVGRSVADFMPDICVEIQSPDDTLKQMRETARFYVANGAKFALVVLPLKRIIEAYSADGDEQILTADEVLTFGDLLLGFEIPVSRFFPQPGE